MSGSASFQRVRSQHTFTINPTNAAPRFAEKWRMRIRLLFSGCKVKNFPKWATLDKYLERTLAFAIPDTLAIAPE